MSSLRDPSSTPAAACPSGEVTSAGPEAHPPLAPRLRRASLGLAVALLAVALVHGHARPRPPAPSPIPCARAGLVDGRLRCDDELPHDPAALCPGPVQPRAHEPIAAGDALDTAQLCARSFASPHEPGHGWSRMPPDELAALGQPVDVNRASLAELESLPRVGPTLARRIVEGRPYADVDALERVRGIGPATLQQLRARAVAPHRASPHRPSTDAVVSAKPPVRDP